jgi:hypothetical protein
MVFDRQKRFPRHDGLTEPALGVHRGSEMHESPAKLSYFSHQFGAQTTSRTRAGPNRFPAAAQPSVMTSEPLLRERLLFARAEQDGLAKWAFCIEFRTFCV